jgi:hypothetical protein
LTTSSGGYPEVVIRTVDKSSEKPDHVAEPLYADPLVRSMRPLQVFRFQDNWAKPINIAGNPGVMAGIGHHYR